MRKLIFPISFGLVIACLLYAQQVTVNPFPIGTRLTPTGSSSGSGTVSGTAGAAAVFTDSTTVGDGVPGNCFTVVGGTLAVDATCYPVKYTSASAPTDGVNACDTGDIWYRTGTVEVHVCSDGATDDWTKVPTISSADTLTNKTLTSPTVNTPAVTRPVFTAYTIATLPGSPATGEVVVVTDASAAGNCTSGGGSALAFCRYSGSAWVALGDGGSGGGSGSCPVVPLPYEGVQFISNAAVNAMATDAAVYIADVFIPCDIAVNTIQARIGTGDSGSSLKIGIYSADGNTLHTSVSLSATSGSVNVSGSASGAPVTITQGRYRLAYSIDDDENDSPTTATCVAAPALATIADATSKLVGVAANALSGGNLPSTTGAITWTTQEAPCLVVLIN